MGVVGTDLVLIAIATAVVVDIPIDAFGTADPQLVRVDSSKSEGLDSGSAR